MRRTRISPQKRSRLRTFRVKILPYSAWSIGSISSARQPHQPTALPPTALAHAGMYTHRNSSSSTHHSSSISSSAQHLFTPASNIPRQKVDPVSSISARQHEQTSARVVQQQQHPPHSQPHSSSLRQQSSSSSSNARQRLTAASSSTRQQLNAVSNGSGHGSARPHQQHALSSSRSARQ